MFIIYSTYFGKKKCPLDIFFLFIFTCDRSEILGEVQTQSSTKLPSNKSLFVLGDNASGKTTLIAKLQGVEDPKKGAGLEYAYIDVRDEYRDGKKLLCSINKVDVQIFSV